MNVNHCQQQLSCSDINIVVYTVIQTLALFNLSNITVNILIKGLAPFIVYCLQCTVAVFVSRWPHLHLSSEPAEWLYLLNEEFWWCFTNPSAHWIVWATVPRVEQFPWAPGCSWHHAADSFYFCWNSAVIPRIQNGFCNHSRIHQCAEVLLWHWCTPLFNNNSLHTGLFLRLMTAIIDQPTNSMDPSSSAEVNWH